MNNLININKIIKSYTNNVNVINSVDFAVNEGDFISIIGPSGSGKTTFLNIIGVLDNFNSGKYFFRDYDILKLKDREKDIFRNKNIGFIHQFHYLIPELTTIENVILPLLISNYNYKESIVRAKLLLDEFGLIEKISLKSKFLSGGEQQRVSIARAMINSPSLIIADEMTGNLDDKNSDYIFNFFVDKAKNLNQTIIFVTHNIKLANRAHIKYKLENGTLEQYK